MRYTRVFCFLAVTVCSLMVLASGAARAIETKAEYAVVMDHQTGAVLFDKQSHAPMYPASMTKMMTAYMIFDALKSGELERSDRYKVSEKAWQKGGSKMFVELGEQISIDKLLHGIIIQSGNDACIVVAEGYAGSEARFAERMTMKARELGMKDTVFKNATGWPHEEHVTTAYDLALLAQATIRDFPKYYPIYAKPEFTYNGIRQYNRNVLLDDGIGVDGLKTGHTEAAGYGITISGEQDGRRVHTVVAGLDSEKARAGEAAKLYRYGLSEFTNIRPASRTTPLAKLPVWYGSQDTVAVTTAPGTYLTLPTIEQQGLKISIRYDSNLKAPIRQGQPIGTMTVSSETMSTQTAQVVAAEQVEAASYGKRWMTNLIQLMSGGG